MKRKELNENELAALKAFADHFGPSWKLYLDDQYWSRAQIWRDKTGSDAAGIELQGLRNKFGPSWLRNFKLPVVDRKPKNKSLAS